jgi:hypothetical protein
MANQDGDTKDHQAHEEGRPEGAMEHVAVQEG